MIRLTLAITCLFSSFSLFAQFEADHSFSIVELFTSEGCSSCPPSEQIANELSAKYEDQVIVLQRHVDYWDYLGWKDQFALAQHTLTQEKYRDALHKRYLVTPQFIVDGKQSMNGHQLGAWISKENTRTNEKPINLVLDKIENNQLHISYNIGKDFEGKIVKFALIESAIHSDVKKGENRGKQFVHQHVVRANAQLYPQSSQGDIIISFPQAVVPENCEIVCYMQSISDLSISKATKKPLIN